MAGGGKQRPYLGEFVEPSRNGDHRRQSYGIKKSRSHSSRVTDVNRATMSKIGKTVWWSLSLGPIRSAQGLEVMMASLLEYCSYPQEEHANPGRKRARGVETAPPATSVVPVPTDSPGRRFRGTQDKAILLQD